MKDEVIKKTTGMKATSLEDLTAHYEKLGIVFRKELGKHIIFTGGPWANIAFVLQDKEDGDSFKSPKVMLASFKSMDGMYQRFSYFNIRNKEEALTICNLLREVFNIEEE